MHFISCKATVYFQLPSNIDNHKLTEQLDCLVFIAVSTVSKPEPPEGQWEDSYCLRDKCTASKKYNMTFALLIYSKYQIKKIEVTPS